MRDAPHFPPKDSSLEKVPLKNVLEQIFYLNKHVLARPREYIIEKTVTPEDLELMGRLRMEVALMYDAASDHLMFLTGARAAHRRDIARGFNGSERKARAMKEAERHDVSKQYAATIHVHNHPDVEIYLAEWPLVVRQHGRSPGGDKALAQQVNMEIAMIISTKGILVHKGEDLVFIEWNNRSAVQLVCDVISRKIRYDKVRDELSALTKSS